MNHKKIFSALAAIFSFSILVSIISLIAKLNLHLEAIFALFFALMAVGTVIFFNRDSRHHSSTCVATQISRKNFLKRKNLFLRVSIIAGLFSRWCFLLPLSTGQVSEDFAP